MSPVEGVGSRSGVERATDERKRLLLGPMSEKSARLLGSSNKRMIVSGFSCIALGPAGPDAEKRAGIWTKRWRATRKKDTPLRSATPTEDEVQFVYFLQVGDRIKIGTSRKPWGNGCGTWRGRPLEE